MLARRAPASFPRHRTHRPFKLNKVAVVEKRLEKQGKKHSSTEERLAVCTHTRRARKRSESEQTG